MGFEGVSLEDLGRQSSMESELQGVKRELYDSKEREADIMDQLYFVQDDGKMLQKKVRDLEEENDNLSSQLKKMSVIKPLDTSASGDPLTSHEQTEADIELRIQFDLTEKELQVLKRKMSELDEENEMLHNDMFVLENKLKEKDRRLQIVPEPSSPSFYYEDKIKAYEKAADEFRNKLLEKETEIKRLYSDLQSIKYQSSHNKNLRKTKSLDLETDYSVVVDLKRQLELSQQECTVLKDKVLSVEQKYENKLSESEPLENNQNEIPGTALTGLVVAYVDTENESQLRTQLVKIEAAKYMLEKKIDYLADKVCVLAKKRLPGMNSDLILKIPKLCTPDEIIDCLSDSTNDNVKESTSEYAKEENSCNYKVSDKETGNNGRTINETDCIPSSRDSIPVARDYNRRLSVIDEVFSKLVKQMCALESQKIESVVPSHSDTPEEGESPEISSLSRNGDSQLSGQLHKDSEMSDMSLKSEIFRDEKMDKNNSDEDKYYSGEEWEIMDASDLPETKQVLEQATANTKSNNNDICIAEVLVQQEFIESETIEPSECKELNAKGKLDKVEGATRMSPETDSGIQKLEDKISYFEEEIVDLRIIIQAKEEKNVVLEEELSDLEALVKRVQADSRRREMELLEDMDLIHGKNEILNNLLEIVKDRAEAAEEELERVVTEINEDRASSISSERSALTTSACSGSRRNSTGSDDVFDGSPAEKGLFVSIWEGQFKKRIRSLETLLAEERKKVTSLEKKLEISGSDVYPSAMSDDAKLHMREKELLQSELQESQRHAVMANDQIRSLTDKLKKVETGRWNSPKLLRKPIQASSSTEDVSVESKDVRYEPQYCKTCDELQSVKDQLNDELFRFKEKAEELEVKVEEINEIWVSKNAVSEKEKQTLDEKLKQKTADYKKLEDQLNKIREEDRMKDIFLKERDNNLKEKTAQISRKEELIQEQEDIIRQREEDLQSLFDQISGREKTIKTLTETIRTRDERLLEKDELLKQLNSTIDEKTEELSYMEDEMQDASKKRKESETLVAEMKEKIEEVVKGGKSELETENERLQSDLDNLLANLTELHTDKVTLQNELDKAKHALSEAMLMWDRDRSTMGCQKNIAIEKLRMFDATAKKTETQAVQAIRKECHTLIEIKEKLAHELRLTKMENDNQIRILKTEKFKLTEELTSKIRMLTHEMSNNDKMSDELSTLRGQDDINYQLHYHEKILRAEYLGMKVRYETKLEQLQKEHLKLLVVVERLQREKNLDQEIIVGIQNGMANIRATYTHDLTRWKDERNVLESHITQIEEGKEIAQHLRSQIDALRKQLSDQDMERSALMNKMTTERRNWDIENANQTSKMNQLEEQLTVFVQLQSNSKDVQYRMEIVWQKEREEQKRLLAEAHRLTLDLQDQLQKRDEEHSREKKNIREQLERQRQALGDGKLGQEKMALEVTQLNTNSANVKHLESITEELKTKHQKEQDFWMREKGDLLRRLAEMRRIHVRDVRRIEDVLTSLKRLRELAAIVIESDNTATLPSNGMDGATISGDASAASASVISEEPEMGDIKQNIDQVILKYVKESLRQIHFAAEELSRPVIEITREEKQQMRRSLSSSEIELLKDEFLLGPQDSTRVLSRHETIPEVKSQILDRQHVGLQRRITHDGSKVKSESVSPDYIENILMEQSSFYREAKDHAQIEVHRIKTTKDVTRTETKVTSLPKPPPNFIIPRSRSTSPAPHLKTKQTHPVVKSISIDNTHNYRLSAPVNGACSRSSSIDSSPVGNYPAFIPPSQNGLSHSGPIQSGSLDRLSPNAARKKFFESQPSHNMTFTSWSDRKQRQINENRNSKSLSSTEFHQAMHGDDACTTRGQLRTSVSMDDGVAENGNHDSDIGMKKSSSLEQNSTKHSGLRDMFKTLKRKLKPNIKRSHSAREADRLKAVEEKDQVEETVQDDNKHVKHESMTPVDIPDDEQDKRSRKGKQESDSKKSRSRSTSKKASGDKDDTHTTPETTMQKIKNRFRSKSADRARDRHVTPILVGGSGKSQTSVADEQFSETCV